MKVVTCMRWSLAILLLAVVASQAVADDQPSAPDVKVTVADKAAFDKLVAANRGKVILVDYWATWCLPCVKQLPHTLEMRRKYAKAGLVVVTISLDDAEERDNVAAFLKARKAETVNLLIGSEDEVFQAFGIDGGAIPHYQVFDREGNVARKFSGADPENKFTHEDIEVAVKELLAK